MVVGERHLVHARLKSKGCHCVGSEDVEWIYGSVWICMQVNEILIRMSQILMKLNEFDGFDFIYGVFVNIIHQRWNNVDCNVIRVTEKLNFL